MLEPWRGDNATLGQATENTIAFQRPCGALRVAPAGGAAELAGRSPGPGPDLLGLDEPRPGSQHVHGRPRVTVRVYVERAHSMGIRRSTWSRAAARRGPTSTPRRSDGSIPAEFWTPVAVTRLFDAPPAGRRGRWCSSGREPREAEPPDAAPRIPRGIPVARRRGGGIL